jgi:hypothetical protein
MAKCIICNSSYNLVKQLTKSNQLLYNLPKYKKDAKIDKLKELEKIWQDLEKDHIKHAKRMKALLVKLCKQNKFK